MPNAVYESVVSRLATQAPLVAKGLVQAAFARRGLSPETVTPFELRRLLDSELLPKIARIVHGHANFAGLGIGRIETDAAGAVVRVDPVLRALLPDLDLSPDAGLAERLRAASVLLPEDAADWGQAAVLVRAQTRRGRVLRLTNVRHGGGCQLALLQDVTLEAALERESALLHAELQRAHAHLTATQAQLVQRETLASLGGLVAGVAHEINTPVGIGVTAITHLAHELEGVRADFSSGQLKRSTLVAFLDESEDAIGLIRSNLERAAQLVKSFKMVSADQTSGELRDFALADYLADVVNSLGPRLKKTSVHVALDCPPELVVHGAPGALAQVVTNFVVNALTHAFVPGVPGEIAIAVRRLGERVQIRVSDNGRGMSDEERQAAFRPFFTTRRHAGGTGLGLSIVYRLVTEVMQGEIDLDSAPGAGTTFRIHIPLKLEAAGRL